MLRMDLEIIGTLGISLGLGLLVGLQREHAGARFAGIRTFPIITLLGTLLGLLVPYTSSWVLAAGLTGIALLAAASTLNPGPNNPDYGRTTEITALLMFALGAYLVLGERMVAVVLGGAVVVLLHLKTYLHSLVDRFGERDLKALMPFAVISLVILPVLPDRNYGPYGAWNPREIWLMVVLIVGLSIAGYCGYKFLGHKRGTLLGGILGGFISSTATTVTYARKTKSAPALNRLAALIILIASAIAFLRVMLEVAVVAPNHLAQVAPPLAAMFVLLGLLSAGMYFFTQKKEEPMPEPCPDKNRPPVCRPLCPGAGGRRSRKSLFWQPGPVCGGGDIGPYRYGRHYPLYGPITESRKATSRHGLETDSDGLAWQHGI